jgi:O-antigen/teichoic acid export membrane protein
LAGILGTLVKLIGAIIIIKSGFVLGGAIAGFFLGSVFTYLATLYFLKSIFRSDNDNATWKNPNLYSVKKYITPVIIGNLAINILGNADMVLAKHNLSSQLAGQYGALTIVSKIIFFATGIIATVLFSMSAESNHKKNSSVHILKNAVFYMGIISLGAVILYFSFSRFILGLLFGGKYDNISHFLGWFSVLVVLYSFANLFLQYFLSIHKTRIAYVFLLISIIEIVLVFLVGHSIFAILVAVIAAQILALISSLIFLMMNKDYKIAS